MNNHAKEKFVLRVLKTTAVANYINDIGQAQIQAEIESTQTDGQALQIEVD